VGAALHFSEKVRWILRCLARPLIIATGPTDVKLTAMPSNPDQQPDPVEKNLGDQATGADVSRTDEERSLGDQSTTGDALSSLSNPGSDLGEAIDSDLPLIDLAARYEIEGELGRLDPFRVTAGSNSHRSNRGTTHKHCHACRTAQTR